MLDRMDANGMIRGFYIEHQGFPWQCLDDHHSYWARSWKIIPVGQWMVIVEYVWGDKWCHFIFFFMICIYIYEFMYIYIYIHVYLCICILVERRGFNPHPRRKRMRCRTVKDTRHRAQFEVCDGESVDKSHKHPLLQSMHMVSCNVL